jgi:hypothetical protein
MFRQFRRHRSVLAAATTAAVAAAAVAAPSASALDPATLPSPSTTTIPGTTRVVDEWKLVGRGSASAVQIAPRWTLSSGHSGMLPGTTFSNSYGTATVLKQYSPVNGHDAGGPTDLKLQLLDHALPAPSFPAILSQHLDYETAKALPGAQLSAGFGGAPAGVVPTVGWSDAFGDPLPGGPSAALGTGGDSGGGVFWYPSSSAPAVLGAVISGGGSAIVLSQQALGGTGTTTGEDIRAFMTAAFAANPSATPPVFTGLDQVLPPVTGARPTPVSNVRVTTPGASTVTIGWSNPTGGIARTGFKVLLDDAPVATAAATATSVKLRGLSWLTRYRVRVVPTSAVGDAYPSTSGGDTTVFKTRWLF